MIDPLLIDLPMPIVTKRLSLRPPQTGDGAYIYEAKRESWAELARWDIWTWGKKEDHTIEGDEAFCLEKRNKFLSREGITLLSFDRHSGEFVGVVSLNKPDWDQRIFMLGFWVTKSKMGNGYATEAAMAHYAFDTLSASKLTSFHAEGNIASQHVLEKLGFQRERLVANERHYSLLKGKNLPPLDPVFEKQMAVAEEITKRRRKMLHRLAK